ncbi:DoxX family protein [Bacteroidota bacterium]
MDQITRLNKWANAHTNIPIDIVRVVFGGFLFYKGLFFVKSASYLVEIAQPFGIDGLSYFTIQTVPMFHIVGGVLIAIGLLTRLTAAIHVPLLAGALVVNLIGNLDMSNLLQASVALLLCCFFLFYGSGKHSLDYRMKLNQ